MPKRSVSKTFRRHAARAPNSSSRPRWRPIARFTSSRTSISSLRRRSLFVCLPTFQFGAGLVRRGWSDHGFGLDFRHLPVKGTLANTANPSNLFLTEFN